MTTNRKLRISRNSVLFLAGLSGMGYTTLSGGAERPTLILAFLAMMGLPAFLSVDEKKKGDGPGSGGSGGGS